MLLISEGRGSSSAALRRRGFCCGSLSSSLCSTSPVAHFGRPFVLARARSVGLSGPFPRAEPGAARRAGGRSVAAVILAYATPRHWCSPPPACPTPRHCATCLLGPLGWRGIERARARREGAWRPATEQQRPPSPPRCCSCCGDRRFDSASLLVGGGCCSCTGGHLGGVSLLPPPGSIPSRYAGLSRSDAPPGRSPFCGSTPTPPERGSLAAPRAVARSRVLPLLPSALRDPPAPVDVGAFGDLRDCPLVDVARDVCARVRA